MNKVNIPEAGDIVFKTKAKAISDTSDPDRNIYLKIFKICEHIRSILYVICPDISLYGTITSRNEHDGSLHKELAMMYSTRIYPFLNNNIVQIALYDNNDSITLTGTLAHEIRHIYQDEYNPSISENVAQGYYESLYHPAEIDADGFAIWYLSTYTDMTLEEAAAKVNPEEKRRDPKAFQKRIERANEIGAGMEALRNAMAPKRETFIEKIKRLLTHK